MSGTGTSFWGQRWSEGGGEGAAPAESVGTGLRPPSSLGKEGVSLWHDVTNPSVPQKLCLAKSSSSNEKIREVQHMVQQRIPHWPEICASSSSCYNELQTHIFSVWFLPVDPLFLPSSYIFPGFHICFWSFHCFTAMMYLQLLLCCPQLLQGGKCFATGICATLGRTKISVKDHLVIKWVFI